MTQRLWWRLIRSITQRPRWVKHPSQVACISEDLKCWGAWNTTCRHKAKDITLSIIWMRDAGKRKRSAIFLPDEKRQQSVRWTLEPFQRQLWANFKFLRDGLECTGAFLCAWIPSWTELGREFREERHSWRLITSITHRLGGGLREYIATQDGIVICSPRAHLSPGQWSLSERLAVFMCLSLPLSCIVHIHVPVITIIMYCCIFMCLSLPLSCCIFMCLSLPLSCIVIDSCACHYYYHVYSCACHYYHHIYIHVPVITIIMYYCSFMWISPNTIIMYLIYRCVDTRNSHEDKLGHPSTEQAAEEHDEQETHQGCQICRCQFCCLGFILFLFLFFYLCFLKDKSKVRGDFWYNCH